MKNDLSAKIGVKLFPNRVKDLSVKGYKYRVISSTKSATIEELDFKNLDALAITNFFAPILTEEEQQFLLERLIAATYSAKRTGKNRWDSLSAETIVKQELYHRGENIDCGASDILATPKLFAEFELTPPFKTLAICDEYNNAVVILEESDLIVLIKRDDLIIRHRGYKETALTEEEIANCAAKLLSRINERIETNNYAGPNSRARTNFYN